MKTRYYVLANYNQFYISDHHLRTVPTLNYDDNDIRLRIKADPFLISIRAERNITVRVEMELAQAPPSDISDEWDHVVEASLTVASGLLEVHGSTGESVDILLIPRGIYRVRIYFTGLGTVGRDGLIGNDRYRIILWQAPAAPIKVLKQYLSPAQRRAV